MQPTTQNFELLGKQVIPGETKTIELNIATLHTMTELKVPIIVSRSIYEGPTVLLTAGLHGDELTGIEIVRQIIRRGINYPNCGTIICIPLVNVFGFVNQARDFPDGRDLNRIFPGSANGSLASRFAYRIMQDVVPVVDYVIDFHAGGRGRFNVPQIRIEPNNKVLDVLAQAFATHFILYSNNIDGSFREACDKLGKKYLLFEAGKALDINNEVIEEGIQGTIRFLDKLNMLNSNFTAKQPEKKMVVIEHSTWIRAQYSGMLHNFIHNGAFVKAGTQLGKITDPYGLIEEAIVAPNDGYIICENQAAIVFQGDAVYHISTKLEND
ncbi:succinylglutamate desuccinylase/aspartoacylase family protein [Flavobacterium sp. xlx-214]|uniref:succinylglutamate desuccinylase/aspartoacylase family protein n=1 Tax=unclassified Flavobacterium TaxID=196869 RepID=UPI0013D377DC|nr:MULTISPECIES: succinylglutamate desuccinylase/aspartoacylase family protein [unclassified Flavobacterium]MBA5792211.1 succinylglutamate desuccinylase/aspartoacylase family protein [Flavobacterium sp. xlx-221]QMI84453.1 succinylglutamate desuccinylase/aspartoacylase family protein [Flavobacterium sp. xlx-214]